MRKTVWYLVHDLTDMTQQRFHSQKRLLKHLRRIGCPVDNNSLPQITKPIQHHKDLEDEDVGELCLLSESDHEICVEELA